MTYIEIDTEVCEALKSIAAYLQSIDASLVSIAGTLRQTNTPEDEDGAHAADLFRAIVNMGIGYGDNTFTASQLLEEIYREVPICKGEYEITGGGGGLVGDIISSLSDEIAQAALKRHSHTRPPQQIPFPAERYEVLRLPVYSAEEEKWPSDRVLSRRRKDAEGKHPLTFGDWL